MIYRQTLYWFSRERHSPKSHRRLEKYRNLSVFPCYQSLKTNVGTFYLELKQTKMNSGHNSVKSTMKNSWISECFFDRLTFFFCKPTASSQYVLIPEIFTWLETRWQRMVHLSVSRYLYFYTNAATVRETLLSGLNVSITFYLCLFEYWILGRFLSLHQELCQCPKNLLKKQVHIWEKSMSFLLYKFI